MRVAVISGGSNASDIWDSENPTPLSIIQISMVSGVFRKIWMARVPLPFLAHPCTMAFSTRGAEYRRESHRGEARRYLDATGNFVLKNAFAADKYRNAHTVFPVPGNKSFFLEIVFIFRSSPREITIW